MRDDVILEGRLSATPLDPPVVHAEPLDDGTYEDATEMFVGARVHKWDAIARDVAANPRSVNEYAELFGYSYSGMAALLKTPQMVERIKLVKDQILEGVSTGIAKIVLNLNSMIDLELAIAIPDTNKSGIKPTERLSIDSRHYLMDKVLAARQVVTQVSSVEKDEETQGLLIQARTLLENLNATAAQRTIDINKSRHVYEGEAAVVRAIDIVKVEDK